MYDKGCRVIWCCIHLLKIDKLEFWDATMFYAWPHLYHFFFGSWQHGIFFIIKDIVSKILKGKRFYGQDRDVWEFLINPRKFQELQQTFEKLEDSESSLWGQRGQLRCDGLLMWQRCNTLKKKTGLKAIIMFDKLLKMMEIFTRSHFPSFLVGCWFYVTSYFVTHLLPTKYNRLDMYGMVPIGGKPHLRKNCFPIFFPK